MAIKRAVMAVVTVAALLLGMLGAATAEAAINRVGADATGGDTTWSGINRVGAD